MERTLIIGLQALHGRLCGRCDIRRQVYWMVWQVTGMNEWQSSAKAYLVPTVVLRVNIRAKVGQGWHSGGGEGKRDGKICESTNDD